MAGWFGSEYEHFACTLFYDLLLAGVRWATIKKNYHIENANINPRQIRAYIKSYGRQIIDDFGGEHRRSTYKIVWEGIE